MLVSRKERDVKCESSKTNSVKINDIKINSKTKSYGIYSLYTLCVLVGIFSLVNKDLFYIVGGIFVLICFCLFMIGYLRDEGEKEK